METILQSKISFFISSILAIISSIAILLLPTNDLIDTHSPMNILIQLIIIIFLITLIFFFNNDHKELLKIMLTSILVTSFFRSALEFQAFSHISSEISSLLKTTEMNRFTSAAKFLPGSLFSILMIVVFMVINILVYINHCSINFTNNPSNFALSFNQILVLLYLVFYVIDKILIIVFSKVQINLSFFLIDIDGFFTILSVVCLESFINKKREERIQ